MEQPGYVGRLFFSSIPKCGKNALHTFTYALGLRRVAALDEDRPLAVLCSYSGHLDVRRKDTYAFPAAANLTASELADGMRRFTSALSGMPQGVAVNHHFAYSSDLHATLVRHDVPAILLYRDPRDCLLSMANYALHRAMPPHLVPKLSHLSLEDALILLLRGDEALTRFADYFNVFRGWVDAPGVLSVRFEDIVGPMGGSCERLQIETLSQVARHIGWSGSPDHLTSAIKRTFSPSVSTFHKGQVHAWRAAFSARVREAFDSEAGDLLATWGYSG